MNKTQKTFIVLLAVVFSLFYSFAKGQATRDSLVYTPVKVQVSHDTSFMVTQNVVHDSTYIRVDTIKIPIPVPTVTLKGMYIHPNQLTIGDAASENTLLTYCKNKGVNMLNLYARAYLYTESKRNQLAAFVAKAKTSYGMILVTVDARFTNSSEEPGWMAYLAKYSTGISAIEPLTEKEPWVYNSTTGYDYPGFFYLLQKMGALCKQYGLKFNFYEGWVGSNYSNPQAAVDSMVKYCDRIFMSNYVKVSDYTSTSSSLGPWDNRMDKRCVTIAVAAPKFNKVVQIVEIISLERITWGAGNDFLGTLFACPASTTNKCYPFFGSTYQDGLNAYNNYSTPAVLQYTDVIGRTIFYSKYAQLAQPN